MRRNDDEFENFGGGHQHSSTPDFSTALISDDGRFFGVKVSSDMLGRLRSAQGLFTDWVRRKGENISTPLAKKFAKSVLDASEHEADRFAGKTANVVGYAIVLGEQGFSAGNAVYNALRSFKEMDRAARPLTNAGVKNVAPLSGNNEVIANARGKIKDVFWMRIGETATGALAIAPSLLNKINEQKVVNRARNETLEFKEADEDKDKLKKIIEKKVGYKPLTQEGKKQAIHEVIEDFHADYETKYNAFSKENAGKVKTKISGLFKLNPQNIEHSIELLEEHGIATYQLRNKLNSPGVNTAQLVKDFEKTLQPRIDAAVERELKTQFVRKEGAFDRDWERYQEHDSHNERRPTHREEIEQAYNKLHSSARENDEADHSHDGGSKKSQHTHEVTMAGLGLVGGLASDILSQKLFSKTKEKYARPIALDRILHLRREVESGRGHPPERLSPCAGDNGGDTSYVQYVHEIFQQHQRDCGRTAIGERFIEHLQAVGWDDTAAQQLPDDQLTSYELAVKTIAKRIKDGRMDAIALIDFVGDKHKKIVRNNGRSFGPLNSDKDEAAVKKAIVALIDEKTAALHVAQKQTDDQINEKFADFTFSLDDLKASLDSKAADQSHSAFIYALVTEILGGDDKILQKIGVSKARRQELNEQIKNTYNDTFDSVAMVIADMIQNEPEVLAKELKLTENQKQLILSLPQLLGEGKHAADVVNNRDELVALTTVVANAAMTLGKEKPGNNKAPAFWQKVVTAKRALKEPKIPAKETIDAPIMGQELPPAVTDGVQMEEAGGKFAKGFAAKHEGGLSRERGHRHRVENDTPTTETTRTF